MNTPNMLVNISSNVRVLPKYRALFGETVSGNEQPLPWTMLTSADSPNVASDMDVTHFGLDEEAGEESDIEC